MARCVTCLCGSFSEACQCVHDQAWDVQATVGTGTCGQACRLSPCLCLWCLGLATRSLAHACGQHMTSAAQAHYEIECHERH